MDHQQYMQRAIELAMNGLGAVSPNPLVGCVIVNDGKIVGEGWHGKFGEHHAEVNAIHDLDDVTMLNNSTVYVNLEPCSHHGKTPPCADLLVKNKIKSVVIANQDPNPLVMGKGIAKLESNGVKVVKNVMEEEGRMLNKRFFTYFKKHRPYILLKWAETADGFIAKKNYDSKWISNKYSRKLVHQWRSQEDAVLIGTNTAIYDNPKLTVRDWEGRDPIRIVIDRKLRIPADYHLFRPGPTTLCYNLKKSGKNNNVEWIKLTGDDFINQLVSHLYERQVQSVIVEGGPTIMNEFIKLNLWDEARVFKSMKVIGKGIKSLKIETKPVDINYIMDDKLEFHYNYL